MFLHTVGWNWMWCHGNFGGQTRSLYAENFCCISPNKKEAPFSSAVSPVAHQMANKLPIRPCPPFSTSNLNPDISPSPQLSFTRGPYNEPDAPRSWSVPSPGRSWTCTARAAPSSSTAERSFPPPTALSCSIRSTAGSLRKPKITAPGKFERNFPGVFSVIRPNLSFFSVSLD